MIAGVVMVFAALHWKTRAFVLMIAGVAMAIVMRVRNAVSPGFHARIMVFALSAGVLIRSAATARGTGRVSNASLQMWAVAILIAHYPCVAMLRLVLMRNANL
jgi:hypothetical protein